MSNEKMIDISNPIERLREQLKISPLFSERNGYEPLDRAPLLDLLDEIEAAYIKLPVDVDGVPWHIGDTIEGGQELEEMLLNKYGWMFNYTDYAKNPFMHHHAKHAKHDTVESLLHEFQFRFSRYLSMSYKGDDTPASLREEYSERIRKAVEQ